MTDRLVKIIAEHFSIDSKVLTMASGPEKGDIALWDSFSHITLILEIEKQFQVKFKAEEIPKLTSVGKINEALGRFKGNG